MRVFIAIDIPENIRKEIMAIQNNLPEFSGRKTEPENLHLTLKFLGEIDEEKLEDVKKKLSEIKFRKFQAEISEIGVFTPSFLKIIWVKLSGCDEIMKEVDKKLEGLFKKEARFMSHLTIARVKKVEDRRRFLDELRKIRFKNLRFLVNSIKLKKSTLTPEKPIYEDVLEVKLV